MYQSDKRLGWPTIGLLGLVVTTFMALSLLVTASGTARFATSMGYDAAVGYAVGVAFDIGKSSLPIGVLALWARRSVLFAALFSLAWLCLVVFSCLATHATVTTAITSVERTGTWKMEVRGNDKAELAEVEQQLAALSRPTPPRPSSTVQGLLNAANVPRAIWRSSNECHAIPQNDAFARECAHVVRLRSELVAAHEYERVSARAHELRKGLADAPIVAVSDPLSEAFVATLGRVVPLSGKEGIALLLTFIVEIMSGFGLAGLTALRRDPSGKSATGSPRASSSLKSVDTQGGSSPGNSGSLHCAQSGTRITSLQPAASAVGSIKPNAREGLRVSSNVLPLRSRREVAVLPRVAPSVREGVEGADPRESLSHVTSFAEERLAKMPGASVWARDLRAAYEAWCATHGHRPLSQQRLAAELKMLGFGKTKSCGRMRYRDLQLAA